MMNIVNETQLHILSTLSLETSRTFVSSARIWLPRELDSLVQGFLCIFVIETWRSSVLSLVIKKYTNQYPPLFKILRIVVIITSVNTCKFAPYSSPSSQGGVLAPKIRLLTWKICWSILEALADSIQRVQETSLRIHSYDHPNPVLEDSQQYCHTVQEEAIMYDEPWVSTICNWLQLLGSVRSFTIESQWMKTCVASDADTDCYVYTLVKYTSVSLT